MKIAYKLTDSEMRTHNEFQWELGKWYETTGEGKLCSPGWLHFYSDPLVGLFMNPAHMDIRNPRLFRAEVKGNFIDDNGLKCGYTKARLVEELPLPQISPVQWIRFAIFCAKEVYKGEEWNKWANNWLSGKDRTEESAASAESAVSAAESTAKNTTIMARSAEESAFYAAKSATFTSEIIVNAAKSAFYATESADFTLEIIINAAKSAASAAESVAFTTESKKIDLIGIAQKAMEE